MTHAREHDGTEGSAATLFGWDRHHLHRIVERLAGEPVERFEVRIEHQVQGPPGLAGEKMLPTFLYRTRSGRSRRATIFVKRQRLHWSGRDEAHHYRSLGALGAPVPKLWGALADPQGRETVFLEYLDVVTDADPWTEFLADPVRLPKFLQTIARINALHVPPEYVSAIERANAQRQGPPGGSWPQWIQTSHQDLHWLWEQARAARLGRPMQQFAREHAAVVPALEAAAERLGAVAASMPKGLCVFDCYPHHTGWRTTTGELLVFDLADVTIEARFWDIAPWVGPCDCVLRRSHPREQLAAIYLEAYRDTAGPPVRLEQILDETRTLWLMWIFIIQLHWHRYLVTHAADTAAGEAAFAAIGQTLQLELTRLLRFALHP